MKSNCSHKPARSYWDMVLEEVTDKNKTNYLTNVKRSMKNKSISSSRHQYQLELADRCAYLTQREADCMYQLLQGETIISAGAVLGLSHRTVEYYLKNVKIKLGCRKKRELIDMVGATDFMCQYQQRNGSCDNIC